MQLTKRKNILRTTLKRDMKKSSKEQKKIGEKENQKDCRKNQKEKTTIAKTEFNFAHILKSDFSVAGIKGDNVQFELYGDYGKINSKEFKLENWGY